MQKKASLSFEDFTKSKISVAKQTQIKGGNGEENPDTNIVIEEEVIN